MIADFNREEFDFDYYPCWRIHDEEDVNVMSPSLESFIEIWQKSCSVEQVREAVRYCCALAPKWWGRSWSPPELSSLASRARRWRKKGVHLKELPLHSDSEKTEPLQRLNILASNYLQKCE